MLLPHSLTPYSWSLYTIPCLLLTLTPWKIKHTHKETLSVPSSPMLGRFTDDACLPSFSFSIVFPLTVRHLVLSLASLRSIAFTSPHVPDSLGAIKGRAHRSFLSLHTDLSAPLMVESSEAIQPELRPAWVTRAALYTLTKNLDSHFSSSLMKSVFPRFSRNTPRGINVLK